MKLNLNINGKLTIINGKAFYINRMVEEGNFDAPLLKKHAQSIENTVKRISIIVQGLLSFSRREKESDYSRESIKDIIDQTLVLCKEKFRNNEIKLQLIENPKDVIIQCRPVQISQVILNLLNNAFDAIKNLEQKWVKIEVIKKKEFIEIDLIDSGLGIPEQVRDKIMEPFFSTKKIGEGTGLGLSVSLGIIKSHNGELYIDIKSPNTKFTIVLPKNQINK